MPPPTLIDPPPSRRVNTEPRLLEVFCRLKPVAQEVRCKFYQISQDQQGLELNAPDELLVKMSAAKRYSFTRVFSAEEGQADVFDKVCAPMLEAIYTKGLNGLIFTYGVTNSGKTYTMVGTDSQPGLLRRAMNWFLDLQAEIASSKNVEGGSERIKECFAMGLEEGFSPETFTDMRLNLQCFEIYNDEVFDLFALKKNRNKLKLREGEDRRIMIEDLSTLPILDQKSARDALNRCLAARSISDTALNHSSSRSHCFFRVGLQLLFENEQEEVKIERILNIVDLAGAERAKRTENAGQRLKEANKINQSLSCLGRCLSAMKDKTMIPYRETKLTKFLAEYFLEQSSISMITSICPDEKEFEESVRVLNYAALAKSVPPLASRIDNRLSFAFRTSKALHLRHSISLNPSATKAPRIFRAISMDNIEQETHIVREPQVKQEDMARLETKIDKMMEALERLESAILHPKSKRQPQARTVGLNEALFNQNEVSRYFRDVGVETSPERFQTVSQPRINTILKSLRKKRKISASTLDDNDLVVNLPVFKQHDDYAGIETKDLCEIVRVKELEEQKRFAEFIKKPSTRSRKKKRDTDKIEEMIEE